MIPVLALDASATDMGLLLTMTHLPMHAGAWVDRPRPVGPRHAGPAGPVRRRDHPFVENLFGYFVKTVALRTTHGESASFLDVMSDVHPTLRAGAGSCRAAPYLPLDPEHPDDRLAFMLADTTQAVVLTSAELRVRAPTGS